MKKQWGFLLLFLVTLSVVSGGLLSQMSLVGQLGVATLYTEYAFLRDWYLGSIVIFLSLIFLSFILWLCKRWMGSKNFVILNLIFVVLGLIGFFYTYIDFTSTAHKYLDSKFHTGAYLFWAGWLFINLFFFFVSVKPQPIPVDEALVKGEATSSSIGNRSEAPTTPHTTNNP